jgi:hypothetical protein
MLLYLKVSNGKSMSMVSHAGNRGSTPRGTTIIKTISYELFFGNFYSLYNPSPAMPPTGKGEFTFVLAANWHGHCEGNEWTVRDSLAFFIWRGHQ